MNASLEPDPQLYKALIKHFTVEELRTLCSDLGVQHEDMPKTLTPFARELVSYMDRHTRTSDLLAYLERVRPNANWQPYSNLSQPPEHLQPVTKPKQTAKPKTPIEPVVPPHTQPIEPGPIEPTPDHSAFLVALVYLIWVVFTFFVISGQTLIAEGGRLAPPNTDDPIISSELLRILMLIIYIIFTATLVPTSYRLFILAKERITRFIKG